ncbi:hypothetical protein [Vibrio parahaemolyticus]|uniref:hypothetical protein n=1 Tax=Vibrio parahaemolyticus TaxID=670 RepID=UPI00387B158A|nr:hypothetical protein [Vibrio parahaemolyticus]HCG6035061.1 hypothetical protein [Vibrio parahaemolyticus]
MESKLFEFEYIKTALDRANIKVNSRFICSAMAAKISEEYWKEVEEILLAMSAAGMPQSEIVRIDHPVLCKTIDGLALHGLVVIGNAQIEIEVDINEREYL